MNTICLHISFRCKYDDIPLIMHYRIDFFSISRILFINILLINHFLHDTIKLPPIVFYSVISICNDKLYAPLGIPSDVLNISDLLPCLYILLSILSDYLKSLFSNLNLEILECICFYSILFVLIMLVFIYSYAVVQVTIVFDSLESLFGEKGNVRVTVDRKSSLIEILGGVATMAQKVHH
jgi:hypothetical protein